MRFLPIFFQIQNLGRGYTREKLRLETKVSLCSHFCGYLHEKINILKRTKLSPRELNDVDDMNVKKNAAHFKEYFKIYYKNIKKMKKK